MRLNIVAVNAIFADSRKAAMMVAEVYDALKEAGASEDKARNAAEAIAAHEGRFNRIDGDLTGIRGDLCCFRGDLAGIKSELSAVQWMIGFNVALAPATLFKAFIS